MEIAVGKAVKQLIVSYWKAHILSGIVQYFSFHSKKL